MVMGFELGTKDRLTNKTGYLTVIKIEGTVAKAARCLTLDR